MTVTRFALTSLALAALGAVAGNSWALGLGRLSQQSALGEPLRAEIDVTSLTAEEASTLNLRVAPADAYRAAGVDYNPVLPGTQVTLARRADGRPYLRLTSDRAVLEPFVDVILEMNWATGRLVREYTLLLDPLHRLPWWPRPSRLRRPRRQMLRPQPSAPRPRPARRRPPRPRRCLRLRPRCRLPSRPRRRHPHRPGRARPLTTVFRLVTP